jgi:hypothetical protein
MSLKELLHNIINTEMRRLSLADDAAPAEDPSVVQAKDDALAKYLAGRYLDLDERFANVTVEEWPDAIAELRRLQRDVELQLADVRPIERSEIDPEAQGQFSAELKELLAESRSVPGWISTDPDYSKWPRGIGSALSISELEALRHRDLAKFIGIPLQELSNAESAGTKPLEIDLDSMDTTLFRKWRQLERKSELISELQARLDAAKPLHHVESSFAPKTLLRGQPDGQQSSEISTEAGDLKAARGRKNNEMVQKRREIVHRLVSKEAI